MKTEDKLKELWKGAIKKDGWGYDIVEADADGILKITAKWIDKNFSPVEPEVMQQYKKLDDDNLIDLYNGIIEELKTRKILSA